MEVRGIEGHHPSEVKVFRAEGEVHAHLIFQPGEHLECRVDFPGADEIIEHPELAFTGRVTVWERDTNSVIEVMGELRQLMSVFSYAAAALEAERYRQIRSIAQAVADDDHKP